MKGRFSIGCGFLKVRLLLAAGLMVACCVAHSAPAADPLVPLRQMMDRPPAQLDLAQAKLALDRLIDPAIDEPAILRRLDILAAIVRSGFPPNATDRQKLEALLVYLYQPGPWNDNHPFTYDLADPMGKDLRNKLLSTYLTTRKGNCVSMPILVIILGQRLGLQVTLATAPEHVLVKYKDDNGQWMMVSPDAAAAANAGKRTVMVPSGSTTEKLGSVNRQADGSMKVEPIADTTTKTTSTAYTATGTLPSNAEAIIHGHPAESGLMDQRGTLGDAGALASAGKPNIAVGADGRMAAHELDNGTYQIRALNGTFKPNEIRHFQREADKRQEFFNAPNK